jgi:hypothetical protein
MFDSDAELMSHVRGQVGVSQNGDLPEQALKEEVQRGKEEISRELRERLNNGESVNFYKSDEPQKALEFFVKVRARGRVKRNQQKRGRHPGKGRGPPDHANAPASVSSMRRHDYDDQTMNHWRDRMVHHLNRVTE